MNYFGFEFRTLINSHGIKGEVSLTQIIPFYPTWINVSLTPINDLKTRLRYATKIKSYSIHELPPDPIKISSTTAELCNTTKQIYNPNNIDMMTIPPAGKHIKLFLLVKFIYLI